MLRNWKDHATKRSVGERGLIIFEVEILLVDTRLFSTSNSDFHFLSEVTQLFIIRVLFCRNQSSLSPSCLRVQNVQSSLISDLERYLRLVTSDFLQRATSPTSNERISQRVKCVFCKEQLLQLVASDFLQRATSATSNEWIFHRVMSDFTKSN